MISTGDIIYDIIIILFLHFVADFLLQSSEVARNKSKSVLTLGYHVSLYSIPFMIIHPLYAVVNASLHFCVDFVTSRVTSYFWSRGDVWKFFVTIGFDQFLHAACLLYTYKILILN